MSRSEENITMTDHTPKLNTPLLLQIYKWLFDPDYKRGLHHTVERSIAFLIIASVMAVLIENTPEIYNNYTGFFHWFDVVTVGIFTLEYVLRVATAHHNPEFAGKSFPRVRYAFSFYALVDLIAIAPLLHRALCQCRRRDASRFTCAAAGANVQAVAPTHPCMA